MHIPNLGPLRYKLLQVLRCTARFGLVTTGHPNDAALGASRWRVDIMNFEDVNARAVLDRVDTRGGARRFGWVASGTRNVAEYPAPIALLPVLSLAVEELLAISDGVATTIRITSGEVWITEEGSIIDHILCAGEQYTFDRPGRALVAARKESRIALYSPEIGVPPKRVERIRPRRAANELLYARSLLLSVIAGLIPFWARRPAVAA